jgi:RNA polymerase sigma factor (sigma-70 family)
MKLEDKWVKELGQGDESALTHLYSLFSDRVYNTILSYTKNTEDAQEVLQDVFVTVFNSASKFQFNSSVSTWIYKISVNKSLDFLRKKNTKKRSGIFLSLFKKDSGEIVFEQVDFTHPGVRMENKEASKILFNAIECLSENQKTAFILTQIEDLPQLEVAEIMEVSRKSVESLLKRAKDNLRKELENHFPERGKATKNTSK